MTCANMIRYVLEKEGNVAAVIAEPARAVPYTPPPGFWKMVREACNDAGALLIFDEIFSSTYPNHASNKKPEVLH